MIARYGGTCADGDRIAPGDEIVAVDGGGWRHAVHDGPVMKVVRKPERPVAEEGFYLRDETVFRTKRSETSGNLYALKLVVDEGRKGRFEYAPGEVYGLQESMKLTVEQAAALGHQLGVCVICGAELTEAKSVAAGIGPVCAKKLGISRSAVVAPAYAGQEV